jgi:hypothetical protein
MGQTPVGEEERPGYKLEDGGREMRDMTKRGALPVSGVDKTGSSQSSTWT